MSSDHDKSLSSGALGSSSRDSEKCASPPRAGKMVVNGGCVSFYQSPLFSSSLDRTSRLSTLAVSFSFQAKSRISIHRSVSLLPPTSRPYHSQ